MSDPRRVTIEYHGEDHLSSVNASASRSTSKLGGNLARVGKLAALGLGAGLLVGAAALVGMTKNAIEDDAAQRKLALALKNTTGATDAQVASVEDWISKQGVALGVTDDELRPAFQRLVQATGDVNEAQRQMSIAMDVSAGTGKSLKVVTEAMMKANNGSTAALGKLGLKTKDANGNTLTLNQSLKEMSKTFGGQAKSQAESLEGKMGRLKIVFDETKETIGGKLIPVLTDFGGWVLNTGIPAAQRFGAMFAETVMPAIREIAAEMSSRFKPILEQVKAAVISFLPVLLGWGNTIKTTIVPALVTLGTYVATKVIPVFKEVANIVVTKVIPLFVKLATFVATQLAPAVVEIAKKIATNLKPTFDQLVVTFRTKVLPTISKLLTKFEEWRPTIQKVILIAVKLTGKLLEFSSKIVGKVLPVAIRFAGWLISTLVPAIAKVIEWVAKIIGKVIDFGATLVKTYQKAVDFKNNVVSAIASIPGKIKDLAGRFKEAGAHIIDAMVGGLKNAGGVISGIAGNVWTAVKSLLNTAIDKINSALSFSINLPGPDIHINTSIPHLARGTAFHRGGLAWVGEEGAELVNLPRGASVTPHRESMAAMGRGGGNAYYSITVNGAVDADGVARQFEQILRRYERSTGRRILVTA